MGIFSFQCLPYGLWIRQRLYYLFFCYKSLTYNTFDTTVEAAFEPIFWFVDFVTRWFGVVFVVAVISLITSVVFIFYLHIIPIILEVNSLLYTFLHLFYGHYLLIMICFHYFQAITTKPGNPPSILHNSPVAGVCKKCFLPKPPRTHHCNICHSCQLKMDHHCPWVNNCVGHFNHRYFISFCVFMCLGTFYVSCSSYIVFKDCFHLSEKIDGAKEKVYQLFGQQIDSLPEQRYLEGEYLPNNMCFGKPRSFANSIVFLWILCSAVTAALGSLTLWHLRLISKGETSIEKLINDVERRKRVKLREKFVNPYDLGFVRNWKRLLGFNGARSFFTKVILPSTHHPIGDGITWNTNARSMFIA